MHCALLLMSERWLQTICLSVTALFWFAMVDVNDVFGIVFYVPS